MSQAVTCPTCTARFAAPPHLYGKQVSCPSCSGPISVPAAQQPAGQPLSAPVPTQPTPTQRPSATADEEISIDPKFIYACLGVAGCVLLVLILVIVAGSSSSNSNVSISEANRAQPSNEQRNSSQTSNSAQGSNSIETNDQDGANSATSGNKTTSAISPSIPVPDFGQLPSPRILQPSGAKVYFLDTSRIASNRKDIPGISMRFRYYLPDGQHDQHSIPCVVIGPSGTNLLCGADIDDGDYHDEALPYVLAGMAVVVYSLDGDFDTSITNDRAFAKALAKAYPKFKASRAGIINGRNAVEFVLARVPEANPQQIYCAGHSSGGTLSLLLAAHEPRIAGCIAYAPATDVQLRLQEAADDFASRLLFPGLRDFLRDSSPKNHASDYRCPVFLFHAKDDSNEPFRNTSAFHQRLKDNAVDVTFSTTNTGDHYQSMIDEGVPRGVAWIQERTRAAADG